MKCKNCEKTGMLHSVKDEKGAVVIVCCDCYMGVLGTPCNCGSTASITAPKTKAENIPAGYEVIDPAVLKSEYFVVGVRWERQRMKNAETQIAKEHVVAAINYYDGVKANAKVK